MRGLPQPAKELSVARSAKYMGARTANTRQAAKASASLRRRRMTVLPLMGLDDPTALPNPRHSRRYRLNRKRILTRCIACAPAQLIQFVATRCKHAAMVVGLWS